MNKKTGSYYFCFINIRGNQFSRIKWKSEFQSYVNLWTVVLSKTIFYEKVQLHFMGQIHNEIYENCIQRILMNSKPQRFIFNYICKMKFYDFFVSTNFVKYLFFNNIYMPHVNSFCCLLIHKTSPLL